MGTVKAKYDFNRGNVKPDWSDSFYPGEIESDNGDGTFAFKFDDGSFNGEIPATRIKLHLAEFNAGILAGVLTASSLAGIACVSMVYVLVFARRSANVDPQPLI